MTFKRSLWSVYLLTALLVLPGLYPLISINGETTGADLVYYLANGTGMIGLALSFVSILLGVRFVAKLISPDVGGLVALHKWLGKYGFVFILLHPVLEMFTYLENWLWIVVPEFSSDLEFQISVGRFALALYLLIWVTSAILRSRLRYRPWLYIHYLSYVMVLLALNHVEDIGFFTMNTPLLGILRRIAFGSLVLIILGRLLYWAGLLKPKYEVVGHETYGDSIYTLTLRPQNKILAAKPGQYLYLQAKRFGEAHPYSLLHLDPKNGEMTFGIKALGPHSQTLRDVSLGQTIFVDGPYGIFTRESSAEVPRVYWAGGIGVTPFVDSVLQANRQDTYLHYSVQQEAEILMREPLQAALGERLRIYVTREPGTKYRSGRITAADVEAVVETLPAETEHYICGSPEFTKAIRKHLAEARVSSKNIYTEEFSH